MSTVGAWLTISIVVTGGLLVGVILGWIDPPKWATPRRVVAILVVVAAVDIWMTYLQQSSPVTASAGDSSAAASAVGLVPVRTIDGAQATRTLLSVTSETTGGAHLLESSLDGDGRKVLGLAPVNGQFALVGSSQLIVSAPDGKQHADGLELETLSGKPSRLLTSPPANETDTDPVITARGEVYFLRTTYIWSGPNGTPTRTRLMRVPIAGTSRPARVRAARQVSAGPLSVNTAWHAAGRPVFRRSVRPGHPQRPDALRHDLRHQLPGRRRLHLAGRALPRLRRFLRQRLRYVADIRTRSLRRDNRHGVEPARK